MNPDREKKAEALLRATDGMSDSERVTFLETVCGDDAETQSRVMALATGAGDEATLGGDETLDGDSTPDGEATLGGDSTLDGDATLGSETTVGGDVADTRRFAALIPTVGDRIGPYLLTRKLGEGGMGVVYEATQDAPIRRTVALKLVKPGVDSGQVLARFESERQALALMSHPNIARVHDAGTTDHGHPFFVMEYTPGVPITDYCDRRRLGIQERIKLFLDVCDGVQHAHHKGMIHRDLKPSNVLVHDRDGTAEVKIIDFGIARATEKSLTDGTALTEIGQLVGTPSYMSPEQADLTNVDIDTRTDVYALGVMLYELLVGSVPFSPDELIEAGLLEMLRRIREDDPALPSQRLSTLGDAGEESARLRGMTPATLSRKLRAELDWITMRAVEKDPERRYGSPADLAADLSRYLRDEPVDAGPPSVGYRARKFVRRHRVGVVVVTTITLSMIAGITLATIGFVRATRAERVARFEADTSVEVIDFLAGLFEISDPSEARGNQVTAREILDRGVETIDSELQDRPDLHGRLSAVMGGVYRSLGLYEDARPLLEAAVADRRRAYGDRSPEVAASLTTLAGLMLIHARGEGTGEIRSLLEEALSIQEEIDPPDLPALAQTLNNLGTVARFDREYDRAVEYYLRGLQAREASLGSEHPELIRPLSNLASLYGRTGRTDAALASYGRALEIAHAELPEDHPDLATVQNNLGNLHREAGRPEQARALLESALAIRQKVLGDEHRQTLTTLYNLGLTYQALGDDEAAVEMFQRTVEIGRRRLSPDHRFVTDSLERLNELLSADQRRPTDTE